MFNRLFIKYYVDNIELNLGSGGKTIATDDVGGIQHELVKVEFGTDGVATMVNAANPLPVTDALGSTAAKQDTGNTSLASIDGKLTNPLPVSGTVTVTPSGTQDENIKQVNGATVNVGVGAAGTGTLRVATSTDSTIGTITTITNNVNTVEVVGATIFNGKTTVATAGSRTTLASSQAVKSVTIKALSTNTRLIYVGNASVASTNGFQLSAGDSISMDVANLNTVNIDSDVNGEGVTYIAVNT